MNNYKGKKSDEIIRDPPWNSLSFKSVVQKDKLPGGSVYNLVKICTSNRIPSEREIVRADPQRLPTCSSPRGQYTIR